MIDHIFLFFEICEMYPKIFKKMCHDKLFLFPVDGSPSSFSENGWIIEEHEIRYDKVL